VHAIARSAAASEEETHMKGQSSEIAAAMRAQDAIDTSKAGTPQRQVAVEHMQALQRIFAKRNRADRLAGRN